MQVIGAGFGRTGTLSLQAALERLGLDPCYHMAEVFKNPKHAKAWDEAVSAGERGEPFDWAGLLGGYEATVDWPGCYFWRELMQAYPEAKVLLSVRDPDRWYESAYGTIYGVKTGVFGPLSVIPVVRYIPRMMNRIWENTFGPDFEDQGHATSVFVRHIEEVKRSVPAERLLVFEVKQGWEPLCEFLGVDVPDEPFPHLNDSATSRRVIRAVSVSLHAGRRCGARWSGAGVGIAPPSAPVRTTAILEEVDPATRGVVVPRVAVS